MKAILFVLFVGLLMVGCGEETQKEAGQELERIREENERRQMERARNLADSFLEKERKRLDGKDEDSENSFMQRLIKGHEDEKELQQETKDNPKVPLDIHCANCGEKLSKKTVVCSQCSRPAPTPLGSEEERRLTALTTLAMIQHAKESGVTQLDLSDKRIQDVMPLSGLTNLSLLNLSVNQITDLSPLAGLTNLRWLDLSTNKIKDITSLAKLTKSVEINLEHNEITDLTPLAGLTDLKTLFLFNNQITDLTPLSGLKNLELLIITNNPIPDAQNAMIKDALPNCDIIFQINK